MMKMGSHIGKKGGEPMDKFESSYSKFANREPYKVACTQCKQLYIKQNDDPFICLTCSAKRGNPRNDTIDQ